MSKLKIQEDKIVFSKNPTLGDYTMIFPYKEMFLNEVLGNTPWWWKPLLKKMAPFKLITFVWLVIINKVLTWTYL